MPIHSDRQRQTQQRLQEIKPRAPKVGDRRRAAGEAFGERQRRAAERSGDRCGIADAAAFEEIEQFAVAGPHFDDLVGPGEQIEQAPRQGKGRHGLSPSQSRKP